MHYWRVFQRNVPDYLGRFAGGRLLTVGRSGRKCRRRLSADVRTTEADTSGEPAVVEIQAGKNIPDEDHDDRCPLLILRLIGPGYELPSRWDLQIAKDDMGLDDVTGARLLNVGYVRRCRPPTHTETLAESFVYEARLGSCADQTSSACRMLDPVAPIAMDATGTNWRSSRGPGRPTSWGIGPLDQQGSW